MCNNSINNDKNDIDSNDDCDVLTASKLQHNQTTSNAMKNIWTKDINWPNNIIARTKALGMVHALIRKIRKTEAKKANDNNSASKEK